MMEQPNNGPRAHRERSLEGVQPPASLLPDVLTRLGLSKAPPGIPPRQHLAVLNSSSASWQEQVQALQAVAELGQQAPLEHIVTCLSQEKHVAVRMAAVRALGTLAQHRRNVPIEHFVYAWNDPDAEVRTTVLQVLTRLEAQVPANLLLSALADPNKLVRIAAIQLAGLQQTRVPLAEIEEALQDSDWQVRETAALTLEKFVKNGSARPQHLIKTLHDSSHFVRKAVAFALGDRLPIHILIRDLQYGETVSLREQTARLLGELGEQAQFRPFIMPPLIEAARTDRDSTVRKAAVLALGQLGKRVSDKHLKQIALQDDDRDVRETAQLILEALYPDAAPEETVDKQPDVHTQDPVWSGAREIDTDNDLSSMAAYERQYISAPQRRKPSEPSYIGQRLGSYNLIRVIGDGGLATVYLGEHIYLKTRAAIKVLKVHLSQKDCDQFLHEGQTIAQLRHPHIVRVLDFGVEQETPYLVMDYAAKGTLRQRHPAGQSVPLQTVISYVKQIASALQYAHEQGIIHRDVKPENMLIGDDESILLSDFGIAMRLTAYDRSPYRQAPSGTVFYMAPEQLVGRPCAESDQYALGIIAYEWLSGSRPFSGPFAAAVDQRLRGAPPPLREKNPQLPRKVEAVVTKALSRDPDDRYRSIREFAQALEQASGPDPRTNRGSTWLKRLWQGEGEDASP